MRRLFGSGAKASSKKTDDASPDDPRAFAGAGAKATDAATPAAQTAVSPPPTVAATVALAADLPDSVCTVNRGGEAGSSSFASEETGAGKPTTRAKRQGVSTRVSNTMHRVRLGWRAMLLSRGRSLRPLLGLLAMGALVLVLVYHGGGGGGGGGGAGVAAIAGGAWRGEDAPLAARTIQPGEPTLQTPVARARERAATSNLTSGEAGGGAGAVEEAAGSGATEQDPEDNDAIAAAMDIAKAAMRESQDAGAGGDSQKLEDGEARLMIEEHFREAQMQLELGQDGNADNVVDAGVDPMDQDNRDLEEDTPEDLNRNHVSDKYQSQNIQIIDGIEFEKVGGEWFPVTTKDPKARSMEEKKIVAHERDEKAASREDRRTQMLQKLVKAGLTEEQAAAVVESKLRGNLKEGHKGRHDANNVGIGIVNSNAGGGAFGGTLGMSKGEMERRRTEEKLDALAGRVEEEDAATHVGGAAGGASWFDRKSVRERLSPHRFIECAKEKAPHIPPMDGLKVETAVKCDQFLWRPEADPANGTEEFQAGAVALEAAVMANAAAQLEETRAPVRARRWGTCALVGNSGMLRLAEFGRSIDSHDTVLRVNQAPTHGYSRRVGTKVTHRIFNRLWTRAYYSSQSKKKNKAMEQYPLEPNMTLLITRATLKEYGLLAAQLAETRPDVLLARVSSRACSMAQPLLEDYRERLCHTGYGPYKGLNVPSSGWVAAHMLLQLCTKVSVYGFGVEGMKKASRGLSTGFEAEPQGFVAGAGRNITYHYFVGMGARSVGNDVHSFDTEEQTFQALSDAGYLQFCRWREGEDMHNWRCGCQDASGDACRKVYIPPTEDPYVDCTPGADCPVDDARKRLQQLEELAKTDPAAAAALAASAAGGMGGSSGAHARHRSPHDAEVQREMAHLQELEAARAFEGELATRMSGAEREREAAEQRAFQQEQEHHKLLAEQRELMQRQQQLLESAHAPSPPPPPSPPSPPSLPPSPPSEGSVEGEVEAGREDSSGAGPGGEAARLSRRERRDMKKRIKEAQSAELEIKKSSTKLHKQELSIEAAAEEAASALAQQEKEAVNALREQEAALLQAQERLQREATAKETTLLRAQQALEMEAQRREAELQLAAKQKEQELKQVMAEQKSMMEMKLREEGLQSEKKLEDERRKFYEVQEAKWKSREEQLVGELNTLGTQYQQELEKRLQQEISMREEIYRAQMKKREEEIQEHANRNKDLLLQKEAQVLKEREQLWRKQQEQKLATERDAMKQQQERAITEERARIESEFAKRASEIAREHEMLNSQLGQAESELLSRQQTLEKELLERSQELESVRKLVEQERSGLETEKEEMNRFRVEAQKKVEEYMKAAQEAAEAAKEARERMEQLASQKAETDEERKQIEAQLVKEQIKSKLVAQAAEKAQRVAEAAIKMGQVEKQTAMLESQKEQERARRAQKEAALLALEAQRSAEMEKQQILAMAHEELEAAKKAREEAEHVAEIARSTAEQEKMAILAEAREIAAQDQKQLELSRQEWEAAMAVAENASEQKLRVSLEEKANEERRLREQYVAKASEERKLILAAKNQELERTQRDAERERERALKAEKVAEAAIRVGDEEKRAAELGRKEAEEEARRAVERAKKAKGVAEAAIRLGEMEKQAALAAKKEAEERLERERNAAEERLKQEEAEFQEKLKALEEQHKEELKRLEEAAKQKEVDEELEDKEEETIPVLEAKIAMLRQMEKEEGDRKLREQEEAKLKAEEERLRAEEEARKFMDHEKELAEKKHKREMELQRKEKERQKQLEWLKNQERLKEQKKKKLELAEERLFQKAKRMDVLDRGTT